MISRYSLIKESYRGILFLVMGVAGGIALQFSPPAGLTVEGYRALIVFGICVVFWVFQVLPLAITSILAVVLLPLFGILETSEAYALFGNKAVFFIIGALILATGLVTTGLSKRAALWVLDKSNGEPKKLLMGVFAVSALGSYIMPEHAVAAMMVPVVLQVAHWLKLTPKQSAFGKALFLAVVWGCVTGGVATFLGGGRAILAVAILEANANMSISFTEWAIAIMPISIVLSLVGYWILTRLYPIDITPSDEMKQELKDHVHEQRQELGRMSDDEITMLAIMAITVLSWVFLSDTLGLSNIALLAVVVVFLFKVVKWREAEEHVNWGVILMYGGAITLGAALSKTGAALYVADSLLNAVPLWAVVVVILIAVVTVMFTEVISNSAVVAMMMPVVLSLGVQYGINPIALTYLVAVPAGLAFMMPMGSPPNALAYSARYYTLKEAVRAGAVMDVVAIGIFLLATQIWWPLIGVELFI